VLDVWDADVVALPEDEVEAVAVALEVLALDPAECPLVDEVWAEVPDVDERAAVLDPAPEVAAAVEESARDADDPDRLASPVLEFDDSVEPQAQTKSASGMPRRSEIPSAFIRSTPIRCRFSPVP
jgi:hypothetical protein